jgi:RNA polymerase sigma-70 factor (ECF subfamily)
MSDGTSEQSDQDSFAELFVTSQTRIFGFIATMLPNRTEAEEVFQQTSLILWKKWAQYDAERNFLSWACGIARLEVFNHLRRLQRTGAHLSEGMMARLAEQYVREELEIRERHEALDDCLEQLAPRQRQLVERYYGGTEKVPEIATELGRSANAVYKTLRKIRLALFSCVSLKLTNETNA